MPTTQGASTPNPVSCLSRTPEGLIYSGDILTYRVIGLQSTNLERLKVTLKACPFDNADLLHVDNFDLYGSRNRESFAEGCAKYLKAQQAGVMLEMSQTILYQRPPRLDTARYL
jgi:hypothetical protein